MTTTTTTPNHHPDRRRRPHRRRSRAPFFRHPHRRDRHRRGARRCRDRRWSLPRSGRRRVGAAGRADSGPAAAPTAARPDIPRSRPTGRSWCRPSQVTPAPKPAPTPSATPSAAVETLQRELGQLNYYEGPITGTMNTQTVAAIKDLQRDAGLPQTGTMNAATQRALVNDARSGKQPDGLLTPDPTARTVRCGPFPARRTLCRPRHKLHLLRNSFRYAGRQHWDAIAKALRPVLTASTEAAAMERFIELTEAWGERYPAIVQLWENAWAEFVPFLAFDTEIRKVICTTRSSRSTPGSGVQSTPAGTSPTSRPRSSACTWRS